MLLLEMRPDALKGLYAVGGGGGAGERGVWLFWWAGVDSGDSNPGPGNTQMGHTLYLFISSECND